MAFTRRTGRCRYKSYPSAGTIAAGAAVQFDESGEVVAAATGKAVIGVAVAAATSSTNCVIDIVDAGSEWLATVGSGTMASSEIGQEADLADSVSITLTESNNDVHIVGFPDASDTALATVIFKKLGFGETVAA